MTIYFRVETAASQKNPVTAGTGRIFHDRASAEAHKSVLVEAQESAEEDIRVVEVAET